MKKPLWDFVEKRMHELGLTRYDLEMDHDVPYATMQRIKSGFTGFKEVTKQKLALALQCSVGDINAAISGTVAEPTGSKENAAESEPPKKVKVIKEARKEETSQKNERPKERWPEDPPDEASGQKGEVMYSEREVDEICKKRINEYKQQLKDLSLKTLTSVPKLNVSGETPYGIVGRALIEKLLEGEAEAE